MRSYDSAVQADPNNGWGYYARGHLYFYRGEMAKALEDFNQARKIYNTIPTFRCGSKLRSVEAICRIILAENAKQLDMKGWPVPVVRLFQGATTVAAVLAAADRTKQWEVCEANFYSGEAALLENQREEARQLFQAAANLCAKYQDELRAANVELKALDVAR